MKTAEANEKQKAANLRMRMRILNLRSLWRETVEWKLLSREEGIFAVAEKG